MNASSAERFQQFLGRKVGRRTILRGAVTAGAGAVGLALGLGLEGRKSEAQAGSLEDTMSSRLVTREWLEQNPKSIKAATDVLDSSGNVIKQYAVVENSLTGSNLLYVSELNSENKFSKYKPLSAVSMANPLSLVASSNGQTLILGGEDPLRSGNVKLAVSLNGGSSFTDIAWPAGWPPSGVTNDLLRVSDTVYIGNNGNYEGGVNQFVITLNPSVQQASEKVKLQQVNLSLQQVGMNIGSADEMGIASINGNTVKMTANGSANLKYGVLLMDVNTSTGQGTVEQVKTVKINNADYDLGFIHGKGTYTDNQGHAHYITSDPIKRELYDIDLTSSPKTATKINTENLLDGVGSEIPGYSNGNFEVHTTDVVTDSQGAIHTWLGGTYGGPEGGGRAILVNRETLKYKLLAPNKDSNLVEQKNMRRRKINGTLAYHVNVRRMGEAMVEINPDGTPRENAEVLYTNKGLGEPFRTWVSAVNSSSRN